MYIILCLILKRLCFIRFNLKENVIIWKKNQNNELCRILNLLTNMFEGELQWDKGTFLNLYPCKSKVSDIKNQS